KRLNWESDSRKSEVKWSILEGELVVLCTLRSEKTSLNERQQLISNVWSIMRPMLQERSASLCLGRNACGQDEVASSYRDAKRTMEIRRVCQLTEETLHYNELGIYLLLYRLQGTEEMEEFKRLYLYPLLELDQKQQGALLH